MTTTIYCNGGEAKIYLRENFAALGDVKTDSQKASAKLITTAVKMCQGLGLGKLLAPLNGDTWHSYRTITYTSGEKKFFLEPDSLLSAHLLLANGFENIAAYSSSQIDLTASQAAINQGLNKRQAVIEKSFKIRPFDSSNFENELKHIFELSLKSFQNNFLYQDIVFEQFAELYRPLSVFINDELVWLAFSENKLVALLFALPDQCNEDQIILKTIAVDPAYSGLGLASYLLARVHTEALRLGFSKSIMALYKDENRSATLSSGLAHKVIRRYGLFELRLK